MMPMVALLVKALQTHMQIHLVGIREGDSHMPGTEGLGLGDAGIHQIAEGPVVATRPLLVRMPAFGRKQKGVSRLEWQADGTGCDCAQKVLLAQCGVVEVIQ